MGNLANLRNQNPSGRKLGHRLASSTILHLVDDCGLLV